ncbi:heme ABC exporter ATP-binding protein CcmA [Sphingorhabdus wooponensis]|uniref:Heme ABC exporter ATP-binding protein CcmA n=1 Tax=Sphingorhabdus wooponensis TaxID=940136 RepID=A0A3R8S5M2_9SPHN|nr:heme ABC exporter ATP-binding protein CcmA [Sphingorhabdus wooponensis]RRQ52389.1 heme ABC exporter ATP-binding protein CcmA [Sphingorhabdus wooponensis]
MSSRQASLPSLHIDNVAVMRGNRMVLRGLSVTARAGDVIWIRGANGCGKSTLLRLVAGLLTVTSGKIHSEGRMALADENLALDANMTVEDALRFWADMDGASTEAREAALAAMDLQELAHIPVHFLSTGQRKRASIARVLASGADIWLMDEPYNGLDSASCARLDEAIIGRAAAGGIVLVAAHQPPSINVAISLSLDSQGVAI